MEELKDQAPIYITDEKILEVYLKNNSNVSTSLSELWNIKEVKKNISEEQLKWNEIRDICDEYDKEAYKYIKNNNTNISISNASQENINPTDISCNTSNNSSECACCINDDDII